MFPCIYQNSEAAANALGFKLIYIPLKVKAT